MTSLFRYTAALVLLGVAPAFAADEDLDTPARGRAPAKERSIEDDIVREVERGYYLKSNVGSSIPVIERGGVLKPGTVLGFTVGQDFIDKEKFSAAWEVSFTQGIHNGRRYEDQAAYVDQGLQTTAQLIQGDIHTFGASAVVEASWYVTRRVGFGVRGGGGVVFAPLLMDPNGYQQRVVIDAWNSQDTTAHKAPHPLVQVGGTFEYYTKLSHFSLGVDADFQYAIGLAGGPAITGYMKYTF
jgi:hypothetical protein